MQYCEIAPSPRLAAHVKCYWTLEQGASTDGAGPEPVVPDGCIEIIFNLADRFERIYDGTRTETQSATLIAGQMRRSVLIRPTGTVDLFGVRFRHAGAFPFFRFALAELTDRIDDIAMIWGAAGKRLEDEVNTARGHPGRVRAIESFLTSRLASDRTHDVALMTAAHRIVSNCGSDPVREVARHAGIGERSLERLFTQKIGLSPKGFSRVVRFQSALSLLEKGDIADLTGTALAAGYYDQAHMINEFREFAGKSPVAFLADAHRMTEVFVGGE